MKFKSTAFLFMCLTLTNFAFAGASDLWQGKGRIALSSDGNKHDNDDMQATMMTLMILAKARLQQNTVLYTYGDHIWGSENNDLAVMKESAEGGGARFGFHDTKFMAAVSNPDAAYDALRDEIVKSTADDPLFIIAAGPMQVVGEAMDRANSMTPASLNHVTVISHSTWNNRHADNPDDSESHSGWTWDEMNASFGSNVNFNKISDQNGTGEGSEAYKSKDKFSAPAWSNWGWMNTHADPNVKWVYTKGVANPGGPDYSDAGMAYYFCADLNGVRGDEFGNPEKLKDWVGTDVIPVTPPDPLKVASINLNIAAYHIKTIGTTYQLVATVLPTTASDKSVTWISSDTEVATVSETGLVTGNKLGNAVITATTVDGSRTAICNIQVGEVEAADYYTGDDYISFEAESTKSPLGKWELRQPGWSEYIEGTSGVKPINNTYLEYTGGTENGNSSGQDVLVYKFRPKAAGTYRLTGRMAQNQNGSAWDKCNDIYVKMEGDFTPAAGSATLTQMQTWQKLYGRGLEDWGAFVKGDIHEVKYSMKYDLKAGVEYTFSVSGRAQRTCIDYYLFVKEQPEVKIAEKADLATNSPEYMRPTGVPSIPEPICLTIEAHDFDNVAVTGFDVATKGTVPGTPADGVNKGELVIGCAGTKGTSQAIAAEQIYEGNPGDVTFTVKAVGEPDGECTYSVYLNGALVGEKQSSRIFGTDIPAYTYEDLVINPTPIAIETGDAIMVTSNQVSNNLVPEGDSFATARGRWASLVICSDDNIDPGTEIIVTEPILINHTAPEIVSLSATEITFNIKYKSNAIVDFATAIHCTSNGNSTEGFKRINGVAISEDGTLEVTIPINNALDASSEYRWVLYFLPQGGTWRNQYTPLIVPFTVSQATGVNDVNNSLTIGPSICTNFITINATEQLRKVQIINLNGMLMYQQNIQGETARIETSQLKSGLYIVKVQLDNGSIITRKIIKQ